MSKGRTLLAVPCVYLSMLIVLSGQFCIPAPLPGDGGYDDGAENPIPSCASNTGPVANAGPDVEAKLGDRVELDGRGSSDVDGDGLSYRWKLTRYPAMAVLEGAESATPWFIGPVEGIYEFTMTAADTCGVADEDTVRVSVIEEPPPGCPKARARSDQSMIDEGASTNLDGTASYDPDGLPLTYSWRQTGGVAVDLSNVNTATISFTAPRVVKDIDVTFELTVSNGNCSDTDTVTITIRNTDIDNPAPVANAGANQTVCEGSAVTLDGADSGDPNDQQLSYSWSQTAGPAATLSDSSSVEPTFIAPEVDSETVLTFELTVSNGSETDSDSMDVIVQDCSTDSDGDGDPCNVSFCRLTDHYVDGYAMPCFDNITVDCIQGPSGATVSNQKNGEYIVTGTYTLGTHDTAEISLEWGGTTTYTDYDEYSISSKGSGQFSLSVTKISGGSGNMYLRMSSGGQRMFDTVLVDLECSSPPGVIGDRDGDGTQDDEDGCPRDPDKTAPGECGCCSADIDTDGDGVADCVDNCPDDSNPGQEDTNGNRVGDMCEAGAPPVAQDQTLLLEENTVEHQITLVANDSDSDALTYTVTGGPSNGTLVGTEDKDSTVSYTPNTDFTGNDCFSFKANDGLQDSAEATVCITVSPGWETITQPPQENDGNELIVLGNDIYFIGGGYPSSSSSASASCYRYSPSTNTWTQKAFMQTVRRFLGAAVLDGEIYAIGGGTDSSGGNPTKTVEKYTPSTDTWTSVESMSIARSRIGATAFDGNIYVFGGYDGSKSLTTIEVYDPISGWTTIDDVLPKTYEGTTALTLGNVIYLFGAMGTFREPDLWQYNPLASSGSKWSQKASPDPGITDWGSNKPNAAFVGQYLTYIPDNSFDDAVLLLYDTTTFEWMESIGPIDDHSDGGSVGLGDYLYAIGGYTYETSAERFYVSEREACSCP